MATVDTEEDEIAGRQSLWRYRARRSALCLGRARNFHAGLPINVDRKPAAVETLEVRATEMVGRTDKLRGG